MHRKNTVNNFLNMCSECYFRFYREFMSNVSFMGII